MVTKMLLENNIPHGPITQEQSDWCQDDWHVAHCWLVYWSPGHARVNHWCTVAESNRLRVIHPGRPWHVGA